MRTVLLSELFVGDAFIFPTPSEGWHEEWSGKYRVWLKQVPFPSRRTPGKFYNILDNETGVQMDLPENTEVIPVIIGEWASRTTLIANAQDQMKRESDSVR